jgi:hypothetical protein
MTISDFLVWLTGGGALVAASWVLGLFAGYTTLSDKVKQIIFFGLTVVFGGAAFAITQYVPASSLDAIAPYFGIVAFAFISIFVNKSYGKLNSVAKLLKDK